MPPKAQGPKAAPKPAGKKGPPPAMLAKLKMAMQAQRDAEEAFKKEQEEEERRIREEERLLAEERRREEEEREANKVAAKEAAKVDKKVSKKNKENEALERMRAAGMILPDLDNKPTPVPKPAPKPKKTEVQVDAAAVEAARKKKELEEATQAAQDADDWEALMEAEERQQQLLASHAAEEEQKRQEDEKKAAAEAARKQAEAEAVPVSSLRSPICCVLGHVDTGKTSLLDRIRRTNVQGGEAGGITQQIGATFFPREALDSATLELRKRSADKVEMMVPGLLVIDTPGHESFTNLRSRGSSLCDIAVLVVDIMHGLEPQTRESLRLLRERKCPFIVALNKVDRLLDWEAHENMDIEQSLALQKPHTQGEFETRSRDILLQFSEEGFNSQIHFRNDDQRRYVSVVPTSAKTGEGVCDLLYLKIKLVQRFMENKVTFKDALACTVLEVKPIQGFGTTIDVVLVNGTLNEGDTIMVCGLSGPIITVIRALLTPQPMKEMRVKGDYVHHQSLRAAIGVKISAQDLDEAVPGTPLFVVKPGDDVERMKKEIMRDINEVLSDVSKTGVGVTVQSSTLGALEALLSFLKDSKIPVAAIALGPLHKRHLMTTIGMRERSKKHAVVLAFDVPISKEAAEEAAKYKVPIFSARIIYHLFDAFTKYVEGFDRDITERNRAVAVFPCVLSNFTKIHNKDPIIVGCEVLRGQLHVGTPLCVCSPEGVQPIGRVIDIEDNTKNVKKAEKGKTVAIKITGADTSIAFGRQFTETSQVVAAISRAAIDALKESFMSDMTQDDWKLMVQLKNMQKVT
jgi:translation initiation factor 5B